MPLFRQLPKIELHDTAFSVFIYCSGKKLSQGSYNYFHLTPDSTKFPYNTWEACQDWLNSKLRALGFKGFKLIFCFRGQYHGQPHLDKYKIDYKTSKAVLHFGFTLYFYQVSKTSTSCPTLESVKTALINCRKNPEYETAIAGAGAKDLSLQGAVSTLINIIKGNSPTPTDALTASQNRSVKSRLHPTQHPDAASATYPSAQPFIQQQSHHPAPLLPPRTDLSQPSFSLSIRLIHKNGEAKDYTEQEDQFQILSLPKTLLNSSYKTIYMSCMNNSKIFAELTITYEQKDLEVAKCPMGLIFYAAAYNSKLYPRKSLISQIYLYRQHINPDLLGARVRDTIQSSAPPAQPQSPPHTPHTAHSPHPTVGLPTSSFSASITLTYKSEVKNELLDNEAKIQGLALPETLFLNPPPYTVQRIKMSCQNHSRIFAKLTIAYEQKESEVAKCPMDLLFYAAAYNSGLYSMGLLISKIRSCQYNIDPDFLGAIVQGITQSFA